MEILSSRVLLRPRDPEASRAFYRDVLGLAVYREFGPPEHRGTVFFLGSGLLEVSGSGPSSAAADGTVQLWLQVRDVHATQRELQRAGVPIVREARTEFWGLIELWIVDPDGVPIVFVQIPADHPLRRDQRDL
ncbi:MAG TPA: VOC family protein [Frankiaceae bacterium]|nr:VOC family protein [Frankiaceae bacterium]